MLLVAACFTALNSRYPVKYASLIREKVDKYALEPAFVAAIVCAESGFDPRATSDKGARGLMQLMPKTAEWIADKRDLKYSAELLFDAEYNLEIGCAYLRYLFDRFGDEKNVAAAYNAGEGNVRKWLADGDKIAFPETAAYVKKVAAAENVYRIRAALRREALSAGISSGAASAAATEAAKREENAGKTVVVLFPDSGDRYYSAALYSK